MRNRLKRQLFIPSIIFYFVCALALLQSCGAKQTGAGNQPYRAIVLALLSVDEEGKSHFGAVERSFTTLTNLDALDGTYLKILRGGELSISEVNGSLVSADSFTGGDEPALRYNVQDGVVVSADYSTFAMLSAYYQFDYIYSHVKDVIGVEPSDLQAKLPGGKHTALFEPQIVFNLDNAEGSAGLKLNAAFSPKDKQFLLFQRSGIENVPLSGNLQVLSHEFGHSLFDYSFYEGTYDEKNYLGDTFALHGINEGWADFVSWNFTQSADILRASINIDELANERHITKTTFKWDEIVEQSLDTALYDAATAFNKCKDSFYCIGTLFARSLIQAKLELTNILLPDFTNDVFVALQSTQSEMKSFDSTVLPTAGDEDSDSPETRAGWERQGRFTGAFLRAFLKKSPDASRAVLCTKIIENFGLGGFPTAAREGVCS